jgi:hypothetical protein
MRKATFTQFLKYARACKLGLPALACLTHATRTPNVYSPMRRQRALSLGRGLPTPGCRIDHVRSRMSPSSHFCAHGMGLCYMRMCLPWGGFLPSLRSRLNTQLAFRPDEVVRLE